MEKYGNKIGNIQGVTDKAKVSSGEVSNIVSDASYAVEAIYLNSSGQVLKYKGWSYDGSEFSVVHSKSRLNSSGISDTEVSEIEVTTDLEKNPGDIVPDSLTTEISNIPFSL
ncbi:hypothetical protein [uncultured Ilyobacter sp.]|uniref:hypothetical protein n=1 Tax=uncultured Ilyobacter sp. TaxID=544433 RepID=UPI0029C68959|nr:hypothetical protein [uncultured Ilyobacter sp.]